MKERPILFSGAMVRAILEGRKTQTRRVIPNDWWRCLDPDDEDDRAAAIPQCPYGVPGDRLWVRETWWQIPEPTARQLRDGADTWPKVAYAADESDVEREENREFGWKLRPSIFMPRQFSRLTLEITSVRVERVQDISEGDASAEGVYVGAEEPRATSGYYGPRNAYKHLWDSINAKRGHSWESNPWVWVLEFRRAA